MTARIKCNNCGKYQCKWHGFSWDQKTGHKTTYYKCGFCGRIIVFHKEPEA